MYESMYSSGIQHWENVKQPGPGEGLWPAERYRHASAVIGYSTLVMIGGADARFKPLKDGCWLFETTQCVWRKVKIKLSISTLVLSAQTKGSLMEMITALTFHVLIG